MAYRAEDYLDTDLDQMPEKPHKVRRDFIKIHFFLDYWSAYRVGEYAQSIGANFEYDVHGGSHTVAVCGTLLQIAVIQGFIDGRDSK